MHILDSAFLHIFYSSLMASVLILLVLSIKKVFNYRLGARFHHVLWILVLIRLLMPVAFESPFSILNLFDGRAQTLSNSQAINVISNGQENESRFFQNSHPATEKNIGEAVKTEVNAYSYFLKVFSRIWLTGAFFLVLFSCAVKIKFKRRTKVFKRVTDPEIQSLIKQCSQKVKIKKSIPVYMNAYFKSPCISGVVHPGIYLPEDISSRVSQHELEHILLHELAHYKRKDLFYGFLATLAALIHWFNPLVWLAAKKMRADREIACDAYVMEMIGEEERVSYGTTIIYLASLYANGHKQLNLAGFYETNSQLKRRISMIKIFKKGSYRISVVAIICCMIIGAVMLTDSVSTGGEMNSNISTVKGKLVLIDPGHGGDDPGAVYPLEATDADAALVKEKDLNLEISLMLYDMLKKSGIRVEMTRYEDLALGLADRVEMANRLDASLFISIHNNAAPDSSVDGTLTIFNPAKDYVSYGITGERTAQLLHEEMVRELETTDDGIRKMSNSKILSNTKMPSVIAEVAHITNEADRQKLMNEDFRKKAAQALHDGVIKVLYEMEA